MSIPCGIFWRIILSSFLGSISGILTISIPHPISLPMILGATLFVNVVPLAAQTQSYIMGMPFSVDDALVAYDYGLEGRQIATWSILTNVPFTVSVNAEDLKHTEQEKSLPYYLCFNYSLS